MKKHLIIILLAIVGLFLGMIGFAQEKKGPEIGICDRIYVGYATPLVDANTFLRFILNPRRPEGSPVPMLSTPAEEISEQEAMKLYRYIISVLEKPGRN